MGSSDNTIMQGGPFYLKPLTRLDLFLNLVPFRGTISARADRSGQFQQWTLRQYLGRKPLRILDLPHRSTLILPRELSAPFR